MDVGIRELKQHLSDYLDRAEAGETIRVTHRGLPKALLIPVPGNGRLAQGIEEGWIRAAAATSGLQPGPRVRSARTVIDVLAEDRGE